MKINNMTDQSYNWIAKFEHAISSANFLV